MDLIELGKNTLVNPEYISLIEKKTIRGNEVIVIWVDGRSYILEGDFNKFLARLNLNITNDKKQYFAG